MATERSNVFGDGYLPMRDAVVSPDAARSTSTPDRRSLGFTPTCPDVRREFEAFLAGMQARRR